MYYTLDSNMSLNIFPKMKMTEGIESRKSKSPITPAVLESNCLGKNPDSPPYFLCVLSQGI